MADGLITSSNLKGVKFSINGLDEYMRKVQESGNNVDQAVAAGIDEVKEGIRADIQTWADSHKGGTGAEADSVRATETKQDGTYIHADVGIDTNINATAWHAVFDEYGSPTQPADPGIRRAFADWKKKSRTIFKKHLKEKGVPTD